MSETTLATKLHIFILYQNCNVCVILLKEKKVIINLLSFLKRLF